MTTIMQPFHCDLQPQVQETNRTMHTGTTTRCRTQRRNRLTSKRSKPHPPHTGGTFHRRLQPLDTEKCKVLCSGFLHKTKPMQHSRSHYNAFCSSPFITTSLRHHFLSSPLPFVTTSLPHHFPKSPHSLRHRFPSSPLPKVHSPLSIHAAITMHFAAFPSSSLPLVPTSHRHHFPSSPLPFVTTLPFLTTSLRHPFPSSPLPFLTISLRHHFPSSPFPFVTASLPHHFPSSPLPFHTTSLHSFLFFCDVL